MGVEGLIHYLNLTLEVFFLDLLLSGDNAIMIALACRSLPPRQTRQAMMLGTGAAIVLRILLTLLAGVILQIPALKLLGGLALTVIAIQLTVGDADADRAERALASQHAPRACRRSWQRSSSPTW
jgi:predicted tellurium resistance membrane protein TerC